MEALSQLISVVTRRRLKKIELFSDIINDNKSNKYYQLYRAIRDKRVHTDEEAAALLYNCGPSDKKYLMLKGRFRSRLLNSLMFVDEKRTTLSTYDKTYLSVSRKMLLLKFLYIHGIRSLMLKLSREVLKKATYFEYYGIIIQVAELLRYDSGLRGDKKQYSIYDHLLTSTIETWRAELFSTECYERVSMELRLSSGAKPEIVPIANEYISKLKKLATKYNTYIIRINLFRLRYLTFLIQNDLKNAIRVCTSAESYYAVNPQFIQTNKFVTIMLTKLECFTRLGYGELGLDYARKCMTIIDSGNYNRLLVYEYSLLLAMATGNYETARKNYALAIGHIRFNDIPVSRKEKWRIYQAYLAYVDREAGKDFKVGKFINEVPIFSKDKGGYNVSILILQLLFLLEKRDYKSIIDRMDALKVYRSRYLKAARDYRSNTFIKMLLVMERKDFNRRQVERMAKKYLLEMEGKLKQEGGALSELEVIPYEVLWKNVLKSLA